jgi:hypothetical protein
MTKLKVRQRGRPRTLDYAEIRALLDERSLKDVEVAAAVGCSSHHIWRLKTEWGLIPDRWAVEA